MIIRKVKWTVLAVGEGDAEMAFLHHLKDLYISRGCGSSLQITQAYGKGAGNVISCAIRKSDMQDYDRCVALFDTDEGYSDDVIERAREAQIVTIPSDPCFEGLLLRCQGDNRQRCSEEHKAEFVKRFGGRIQDPGIIPAVFTKPLVESLRTREPLLDKLINTFGLPRPH